eukprot:SAG31_NODE_10439_length_1139_cov_0.935577_1_plen_366_part_01
MVRHCHSALLAYGTKSMQTKLNRPCPNLYCSCYPETCRSFWFFVDVLVDMYFVTDVILLFRTAVYLRDGTREDRPGKIACNYMKGWFIIDFVSSLPISYVTYILPDDSKVATMNGSQGGEQLDTRDAAGGESNLRAMKAIRLVRLSKMLRLARIKKILSKYGDDVDLQTYVSISFNFFIILFLVHIMTCFYYLIGTSDMLVALEGQPDVVVHGWVNVEPNWNEKTPVFPSRYVSSAYYVLNALENGSTDAERAFALLAEFMRDVILGMVAGLMTTILMAINSTDNEVQWKVRALKGWMNKRKVPKSLQIMMVEYCNELWGGRGFGGSGVQMEDLFKQVPPGLRLNMTTFLHGSTVAHVPLFRGLSR